MSTDPYRKKRQAAAARDREATRQGRDIGELPKVRKPARKRKAIASLRTFCESYFAERFALKWSADHLTVIAKIEIAVRDGGLFALAMPRGSGKTTLVECSVMWAILGGYRRFIALIGSDETSALELLASIKIELETNDALLEDFPEACYPIVQLDGISHRCRGQLHLGARTHIGWQGKTLVMPTIPASPASGAIVKVAGITGRIRGMKHARADGLNVRPDLVVIDDPQTDESARSPTQCEQRESIVAGAILGLAGPGKKIAGVMPCTVIRKGDMADRILDRKKHPEWQGERMRMVYEWPTDTDHWTKYGEILHEELANDRGIAKATAYYKKHRKPMDAGGRVGWPERFNSDEISALQHAWNLRLRDPNAFDAEYQNDPRDQAEDAELLSVDAIQRKINGYRRGEVPHEATHITGFIDVQGQLLYWLVAGWADDFTGYVLDYGTWPDQRQKYFALAAARHTLERRYPRTGLEGRLFAGLKDLVAALLGRKWIRDDQAELSIERLLIDANWGASTEVVYQFIRQHGGAVLLPSHGRGVKASERGMHDWKKAAGERVGLNWRLRATTGGRAAVRHVLFDTNFWKSFVHARLAVAVGDRGCVSLFQPAGPTEHRMFAEHLRAEDRQRIASESREVDEWRIKPGGPDNHLFDCFVGAAVAASIQGCSLEALARPKPARRRAGVRYL